jgi:hypothetical protein
LSAGAAFDHSIVRREHWGVHRWLFRRWNAFSIAATSISALALSLLPGCLIGIPRMQIWWLGPVIGFSLILVPVAYWAWRDTMKMVEFMAMLPPEGGP